MVFRVTYMAALLGVALSVRSAPAPAAGARPKIEPIARGAAAAGPTYTIVDIGAPPVATYPSSAPVGFNNTGQIYGVALRAAKADRKSYAADTDCLVWTGTRFVDLSPSLTVQACTPSAMSSAAVPGGSVSVVGTITDIHHAPGYESYNFDAFSALIAADGTAKLLPYYDHSPAALYGVNLAGTAVGYSYTATTYGAIFVTTPPEELARLQPGCTSPLAGCLETFDFLYAHTLNGEPSLQCPFGGCIITNSGTVLGFDAVSNAYALSTGGAPNASLKIPLPYAATFVVSINNSRQILYFTRPVGVVPSVYDATAGTSISVPPVAGTSCVNYYPISMNDAEEILGYTTRCSGRDFYWTWDPKNGTRSVNAALPASAFTVTPVGVNDNGEILASLLPATGPAHWGTLEPPATPAARREHVRGVADVR